MKLVSLPGTWFDRSTIFLPFFSDEISSLCLRLFERSPLIALWYLPKLPVRRFVWLHLIRDRVQEWFSKNWANGGGGGGGEWNALRREEWNTKELVNHTFPIGSVIGHDLPMNRCLSSLLRWRISGREFDEISSLLCKAPRKRRQFQRERKKDLKNAFECTQNASVTVISGSEWCQAGVMTDNHSWKRNQNLWCRQKRFCCGMKRCLLYSGVIPFSLPSVWSFWGSESAGAKKIGGRHQQFGMEIEMPLDRNWKS